MLGLAYVSEHETQRPREEKPLWASGGHTHTLGHPELNLFSSSILHLVGFYNLPLQKLDVLPPTIMVNSWKKGIYLV